MTRPSSRGRTCALVLLLSLATAFTGLGAPSSASAAQTVSAADERTCQDLPLTEVGSTPDPAGDGTGGSTRCWSVTPSTSGLHSVRIAGVNREDWQSSIRVTDSDDALVVRLLFSRYSAPLPLVELDAGTTYRIEVMPDSGRPDDRYRLAVDDLVDSTCAPMPEQSWDAELVDLALGDHRLECRTVTAAQSTYLWVEQTRTVFTGSLVLDGSGQDACTFEDPEEPLRRCYVPAGQYRVIVGAEAHSTADPVGLRALPVDTAEGCEQLQLGAWGEPLTGTGDRSGRGPVKCFKVTTPRSSAYDLRAWQDPADDPYNWVATYDLYDVDAQGRRLQTIPNAHDRTYASWVDIDEDHDLRLIAYGSPSQPAADWDPAYRVGLIDRAVTDGCSPIATDWAGPVVNGRLDEGQVDCYLLDSPEDSVVRIDVRGPDVPPGAPTYGRGLERAYVRVIDATGATVDYCEAYAGRSSAPDILACDLTGTAPFRVLVHTDDELPTDYTIDVGDPAVDLGCRPVDIATWGRELPTVGLRAAGGAGSDCWTMTATADGVQRASVWAPGAFDPSFAIYRAGQSNLDHQFPVEAGATYRVIVFGDPGPAPAPYRLGLYDVTGEQSNGPTPGSAPACTPVDSTAVGAPELVGTVGRGIFDCYQLPEGPQVIRLELYGPDGPDNPFDPHFEDPFLRSARITGPTGVEDCVTALTKRSSCWIEGSKRVLVTGRGDTEAGYRAAAWDPYDRSECSEISPVWTYGAAPLEVRLPAGEQSLCLTMPEGERRFYGVVRAPDDVDYLLLDGGGTNWCLTPGQPWPTNGRVCAPGTQFDPYVFVLVNRGDVDHDVRLMLRHPLPDPARCPETPLAATGFAPLTGSLDGDLDTQCHTVLLAKGDEVTLDVSTDDGPPPNVFVFQPDGEGLCGAVADDPTTDPTRCTPYAGDGDPLPHTVLVVATPESGAVDYEVRLSCPDRQCNPPDCPGPKCPSPPVTFGPAPSLQQPVKVGETARIPRVTTDPSTAKVSYYWSIGNKVVSRGRRFTPGPEHAGEQTRLLAIASAAGHQDSYLQIPGRVVRLGDIDVRGARPPRVRGKARPGSTLKVRPVRAERPDDARVRYRWLRDGEPITGEKGRRYEVRRTDRGEILQVRIKVSSPGYRSVVLRTPARRVR